MPLTVGERLGSCEILALIGAGGMGEVYRARDTRLKRDVALKVLPDAFARDPDRMARFQREAEVLASLNHSNIAAIYGVEERALVMELVDGESPKGPMPFDEAWKIASQMADALEYAHDKGVVHRDLKPANIKVTHEGVVKLLDFGLAKAFNDPAEASPVEAADSPTIALGGTIAGTVLGTAGYMAPEQAKGKRVDRRADIWAWGVVLYELLTGERLFKCEDASDTLAQVLTKQPDLERVPVNTRRMLQACLQKDPKLRLRDIGDAKQLLSEDPAPARSRAVPWLITGLAVAGATVLALVSFRQKPPQQQIVRFEIQAPEKANIESFKLSPDGRYLAIAAANRLWLRALDSFELRSLAGTEGASYPFWSPGSDFIGFFTQGKLKKIALAGGPPLTLCDAPLGRGGTWNPDGVIVFAPENSGGLKRVSQAGGVPAPVTLLDRSGGNSDRFPEFLPDKGRFVYLRGDQTERSGIYAGSLDGTAPVRLLPDLSYATYVPPKAPDRAGYLLFRRENTLMAQPFDPDGLRLTGELFPVAESVGRAAVLGTDTFSVSTNGVLAYGSLSMSGLRELVWRDRSGKRLNVVTKPAQIARVALSPDGETAALTIGVAGSMDIWLRDLNRNSDTRFTFPPGWSMDPVWSPDGTHIAFRSSPQDRTYGLYERPATGPGKQELLMAASPANGFPLDWSPDGKRIVYIAAKKGIPI
jgi:eukaryotic-like serine/threonine-protein kinase